jgi:hypothetical protein
MRADSFRFIILYHHPVIVITAVVCVFKARSILHQFTIAINNVVAFQHPEAVVILSQVKQIAHKVPAAGSREYVVICLACLRRTFFHRL